MVSRPAVVGVFLEQQAHGLEVWMQPFMTLRAPMLFNLRSDPFEREEFEAGNYVKWFVEHACFSVQQPLEMMMKQKGSN